MAYVIDESIAGGRPERIERYRSLGQHFTDLQRTFSIVADRAVTVAVRRRLTTQKDMDAVPS